MKVKQILKYDKSCMNHMYFSINIFDTTVLMPVVIVLLQQ